MNLAEVNIALLIQNNTNVPQPINIMGGYNNLDTANATTQYVWNLTNYVFESDTTIILQYMKTGASGFTNYTQSLTTANIASVLTALNSLNIGYFYSYTSAGSTYITTYNDNYVFGELQILNAAFNPIVLFDFDQPNTYANAQTSVIDLSGNSNNGTPSLGTGTGTPTTLGNGAGYYQNGSNPYYLEMPSSATGTQYSLQLPSVCQFTGTQPYTLMLWFQSSGTFDLTDIYQGLISAEGRSGGNAIGYSFGIQETGGIYSILHYRWNGTTNTNDHINLVFGAGGVPAFTPNTWYFVMAGYDGTTMYIALYAGGTLYQTSQATSTVITSSPSWPAFVGLRYNNWLNGIIGYAAIYNQYYLEGFQNIYAQTNARY